MLYSVTNTCEKDRKSKENFYKVGFGFRLNTVDSIIALNSTKAYLEVNANGFRKRCRS